jgi:hypothetical protein
MAKLVCANCGETNEFDAEFCAYCHAFLAWDDAAPPDGNGRSPAGRSGNNRAATSGASGGSTEALTETQVIPRFQVVPDPTPNGDTAGTATTADAAPDPSEGKFQAKAEQDDASVPPTGEPVTLRIRVLNTSTIVDGYRVEALEPPAWLTVKSNQVQLLPGTDAVLDVQLRAKAETLVPAQQLRVALRVASMAQAPAHVDLPVGLTVPVVEAPVQLRAEPRLLRLRDRDTAEFAVTADNAGSNRTVTLRFSAADPELAVRCRFDPPTLELPPGGSGVVRVVATAPLPDPGADTTRVLTVTALDGTRSAETSVTLQQSASARVEDPPVGLQVEPALVRVRDSTVAVVRLVADNRRGKQVARVELQASDPERAVRVSFASPRLEVPPGATGHVDLRLQAQLPEPGSEVSRTLTVTATDAEQRTSTTTATFVQVASASPMATLVLRTDPSVVRVQDADTASSQLVVDNRRGRSGVRVTLSGADPERAIRFAFAQPTVDVGPGQAVVVGFRMDAWRPQPGQESSRPFTLTASDGDAVVEASGTLVQTSSRAAIELLALRLDPTVLRLSNRRRGLLSVVVDNRQGAQPVQVSLRGDDPENSLRFTFEPAVLEAAPGRFGRANVTVKAPHVPGGRELTRPFTVLASDGRSEVSAEGSVIQSAAERRPLARVLLTLLGGVAMIVGGFLPFWSGGVQLNDGEATAAGLNVDVVARFFANANLGSTGNAMLDTLIRTAARVVSVALVMIVLGVAAIFGLTGRSGRLTRLAAFLGAGFVVLVFVAFAVGGVNGGVNGGPGQGAIVLLVGCILAYVGGLLVRR